MKSFSLKNVTSYILLVVMVALSGCSENKTETQDIRLITLDPGHFHAGLIQKSMFEGVNDSVYVYAPDGKEVRAHLSLVDKYNTRPENPTSWKETVYLGEDYFSKMLEDKKGNVVVLAGNNQNKSDYIQKSVSAGLNVLADKPMAINVIGFKQLEKSFALAKENNVMLYDIMTERYNIINVIQKELMSMDDVFGDLEKGTTAKPAIVKESVHHFYKQVSGSPLIRPLWYYDIAQEGDGLVDVTTHMVDIIQWTCFPDVALNYKNDIKVLNAKRWTTPITLAQYKSSTNADAFPDYLLKDVKAGLLEVYANGEMNYTLKDVHAKVSVTWNFEAPKGGGDTHYSLTRGTKANLIVKQGKAESYKPALFIEAVSKDTDYEKNLKENFAKLAETYPGVQLKKQSNGWQIVIPESYNQGHESQFADVTNKFLKYLKSGNMPSWEVPNMLAKYYTTTKALEVALK
ncbi:putative oxidoreductase C-terminal domain-containing protein [Pedobacter arcticus]|uniref:putative oxidoreductase C-terminal domain-containing protein n=1 Tax=Pedobacter arcticus TaxID=752140 RepID=UPI000474E35D|nr:putative oxidoreductase C-terminal domain-containing protein [Pedobacter arcticus]